MLPLANCLTVCFALWILCWLFSQYNWFSGAFCLLFFLSIPLKFSLSPHAHFSYPLLYAIKPVLVLIALLLVVYVRARKKPLKVWHQKFLSVLLLLNVFVMVIFDLYRDNYFNLLAGLLLMLWMPSYRGFTLTSNKNRYHFEVDLSYYWIVLYCIWQVSLFFHSIQSPIVDIQMGILLAAFFAGLLVRKEFMPYRVYSLGLVTLWIYFAKTYHLLRIAFFKTWDSSVPLRA